MKKILRSLLICAAALAVAAGGTGCTAKMKKAYHEARADRFYAAGQFDRAEIEYLNVLRNDSNNVKAFTRLGEIYFDQGRFQTAAPFLARASSLATNDLDLHLKLGQIFAAAGDVNDARQQARFILDHNPQSDAAPLLLAQNARTAKDVAAARAQIKRLAAAGDRAALEVALGTLALHENDSAGAEADFKRALALDPKSTDALEPLGILAAAKNDTNAAAADFKAASDLSPARSTKRMMYARFKMQTGDAAAARRILEDVIKSSPDYLPALMGLGEIALAEKKFAECRATIDKVLARDPDNFDGLMLDSRLKFTQGDVAGCVTELERMSKLYPQAARIHYQLGTAYFASGDDTRAIVSLNRALELDASFPEATMLLAQIQIKNQNPDPAIVSLGKLTESQPQLVPAQMLLADAYRQRGRVDEALAIYAGLEKSLPDNPQIPLLAGAAYAQLGDNIRARAEFDRALAAAPDSLPALEQLVDLDLAGKNFAAAMRRVQARLQLAPELTPLRLLVAKVQLAQADRGAAEKTLLEAAQLDPKNDNVPLLLAQVYLDGGQGAEAMQQLQSAIAKNPGNLSALMLQAMMNENAKDYKNAAATYEKIIELDPKCSPALNNLAWLDSEFLNQPDRAYELAQRARELLPFEPSTADTLGWICFKRGAYPTALALLQDSAAKLPAAADIQYHFGMAAYMTGNEPAAHAALQRALLATNDFHGREECELCLSVLNINPAMATAADRDKLEKRVAGNPGDPVAQGRLAAVYQRAGNMEKALAGYESVLKVDAKNMPALKNLARLWEAKDAAKAYDYAKAACRAAPADAEAGQLYGRLAYENGDFKVADSVLQPLAQNQPGAAVLQFDYARAAYALGKISSAQTALQNALSENLPAPLADEAKRMADLLAVAADPQSANGAAARVAEILKAQPDYVPALMVQAKIKELAGDPNSAAAAGEQIVARFPDFAPAQRELAILYSRDAAKISRAYTLGVKARESYPDDPALAKALGLIIFQQGDFSRAASLMKECAAASPADAEVFYYLGAAQLKLNQNAAAKSSLQQAIQLKLSAPLADSARQMLAGLK